MVENLDNDNIEVCENLDEDSYKCLLISENKINQKEVLEFALDVFAFGLKDASVFDVTRAPRRRKKRTPLRAKTEKPAETVTPEITPEPEKVESVVVEAIIEEKKEEIKKEIKPEKPAYENVKPFVPQKTKQAAKPVASWSQYIADKGMGKAAKASSWWGFKHKPGEDGEHQFLSSDDWMDIMKGKALPQKKEIPLDDKTPATGVALFQEGDKKSPVDETPAEDIIAGVAESPVEAKTPEAVEIKDIPEEATAETEEILSADDWMDIMVGRKPESPEGLAPSSPSVADTEEQAGVTGPHLKTDVDYNAKHYVPKRQTAGEGVERIEATRDGFRKRSYFKQVKLRYRKSFTSSKKVPARICSFCLSGKSQTSCVSCGADKASFMARLCEKCATDKKTASNCIICGRANARGIAKLCDKCAPGFSRVCVKCGARL